MAAYGKNLTMVPVVSPLAISDMLRSIATSVVIGAACVDAFAPGAAMPSLALRQARASKTPFGLKMAEGDAEYKPLIPTPENPMAPDYAREPTQLERQGLVDMDAPPKSKTYNAAMAGGEGLGGLSRRETMGMGGAIGAGVVGVLWAVTRTPGYDRKDTSRDAGSVAIDKEALAKPELQAGLKDLTATRSKIDGLFAGFKENPNIQLTASIQSFSIVKLRNDLNALTTALDEDTQLKTDKLVRSIIQDLVELDQATRVKEGAERTPKKIQATQKWFTQTIGDFDKFIAYFK